MKLLMLLVVTAMLFATAPVEAKVYTPWTNPIIINDGGWMSPAYILAKFRGMFFPKPVIINDGG